MRVLAALALLVGLLVLFRWSASGDRSPDGLAVGALGSGEAAAAEASLTDGDSEPVSGERRIAGKQTMAQLLERIDRPGLQDLERRLLAAAAIDPENGELATDLCEAARLLGHFDQAAAHGERAVSLLPSSSRAHHLYAKALGEQMRHGGLFTAIRLVGTYKEEMATAIALDSSNFRARAEQIAFLLYMPSIGGGDKDLGAELALQLERDDARWGLLVQALVRSETDDELGAVEVCEAALQRFPGDQKIAVTLAGLLEDVGRREDADEQFAAVLAGPRGEAYYLALYQRARMHIRAGQQLRSSIAAMEAYAADEPYGEFIAPVAGAYYRMGSAWEQLGELAEARAAYRQALQLDPEFDRAEEALEDLGEG